MSMETVEYYDLTTTTTTVPRQDDSFYCVTCGESFTENIDLQIHMFNMDHHGQVFTSEGAVQGCVPGEVPSQTNGNLLQPSAKSYKCKHCDETFKARSLLEVHKKVLHSGGERYTCAECGKRYTHEKNLETHMNVHTGENLYSCDVCGKAFTRKNDLNRHAQKHARRQARRHARRHAQSYPDEKATYQCDMCGESFTQLRDLIEHKLMKNPLVSHFLTRDDGLESQTQ